MLKRLIKSLLPDANRKHRTVELLYREAKALWETQQWQQAQTRLQRALAIDPSLPALHYMLGSILSETEQHKAAQAALSLCIERNPEQALHLSARALHALNRAREYTAQGLPPPLLELDAVLRERGKPPMVSVIVCSITPERRARTEQMYHTLLAELPHEIIVISDGKSMCEGYNRGLRLAKGELVLFSHDDVSIQSPDFAARLLRQLQQHDVIGLAGTTELKFGNWVSNDGLLFGQVANSPDGGEPQYRLYATIFDITGLYTPNIQAIDGYFMAARRDVALQLGFDEETFDHWHLYDIDFSWRAYKAGMRCAVANDILACHLSRGTYDETWFQYSVRFDRKHQFFAPRHHTTAQMRVIGHIPLKSPEEWRWMNALMIQDIESGLWKLPYYR